MTRLVLTEAQAVALRAVAWAVANELLANLVTSARREGEALGVLEWEDRGYRVTPAGRTWLKQNP